MAVVGRSGFAVYLMKKRKWKLFGSELQEQNLQCRGGVSWYKDILIFPCKVKDKNTDEVKIERGKMRGGEGEGG